MALQPKTEPGSPPIFPSIGHKNLKQMSISELIQVLRVAWQTEYFDRVEEVLVAREAKLRAEIGPLQEKVELERLMRLKAEEELKKREEQCEKGKRAQESYETLLKEVKKSGLHDKNTIENLRNKSKELERENLKLMELKEKWEGDSNAVDDLRKRVVELDNERLELEDETKKNLATIDELKNENCKLVDKKLKADAKFVELLDRVERLEESAKLLMSEFDSVGGENNKGEPQADPGAPFKVKAEEGTKEFNDEMDVGGSAPLQKSKDARQYLGASAGGKFGLENVIEIEDSDDDDDIYISRRTQAQTIETLKRKLSLSESDNNSSSSGSLNMGNLPLSNRGNNTSNKKCK